MSFRVNEAVAALRRHASKSHRDGLARYGIPADKALGVPVRDIQKVAKTLGRDHALAGALWKTGWLEARMLAAYVDDPERITSAQMDAWAKDFDNWAVVDTLCFVLFDKSPHAWKKVSTWAASRDEFVKRAAFALLWGLTVHDKESGDAPFLKGLQLVEKAASDERHFVKKAVNMALRAVGKRNAALNAAAVATATKLFASPNVTAKAIGREALRELSSASVKKRLAGKG